LPQLRSDDDDLLGAEPHEPGPARQILRVAVPVAAVIAIVVVGWLSGLALGRVPGPGRGFSATTTGAPSPGSSAAAAIRVVSVRDFDPYGDQRENSDQAPYAVDGDTSTAWQTGLYRRRGDFGGLKPGVGLLIDFGRPRAISGVAALLTKPGADIELRAANAGTSATGAPQQATDYRVVASAADAGKKPPRGQPTGTVELNTTGGPVTARFWLVWLTKVPRDGSGYRDGIAELTFHG
jgi:putative peptidoglycan lipid II flippase